jgi:cellobiose-specific phosphotransferase system component IIA
LTIPCFHLPEPLQPSVDRATQAFLQARIAMSDGEFGRASEALMHAMRALATAHRITAALERQAQERD